MFANTNIGNDILLTLNTVCNVRGNAPDGRGGIQNVCDPTQGFHYDQQTIDNFGTITKRGHRVVDIVLRYYSRSNPAGLKTIGGGPAKPSPVVFGAGVFRLCPLLQFKESLLPPTRHTTWPACPVSSCSACSYQRPWRRRPPRRRTPTGCSFAASKCSRAAT